MVEPTLNGHSYCTIWHLQFATAWVSAYDLCTTYTSVPKLVWPFPYCMQ
jgi:hypothetical protein